MDNTELTKIQSQEYNSPSVARQQISASFHSGPLPSAEDFTQYERVCRGAANRIITMAEKQAAHRQEIEKLREETAARNSKLGIYSATGLAFLVLVLGFVCIINDHDWAGGIIVGLDLVGLCSVFIYGTSLKNKNT